MSTLLSQQQLDVLGDALHRGSGKASSAMAAWLQTESLVELDSLNQVSISESGDLFGDSDQILGMTTVSIEGGLQGQLVLGFSDASGLSLCDLILNRSIGRATEWGEIEQSAALETMNIIGSVYLNSLADFFQNRTGQALELLPSPPNFQRDFAVSLIQSAVVGQAMFSDTVLAAKTRFTLRGESLDWTLLFIPDGASMERLAEYTAN